MTEQTSSKTLVITYTKSTIGYTDRQVRTIRALGLRRLGDVVEHEENPAIRGMIAKVSHLVTVEERSA